MPVRGQLQALRALPRAMTGGIHCTGCGVGFRAGPGLFGKIKFDYLWLLLSKRQWRRCSERDRTVTITRVRLRTAEPWAASEQTKDPGQEMTCWRWTRANENSHRSVVIQLTFQNVPASEPYCRVFKRRSILNLTQTERLRWSRDSVLAIGTQVRGFKPGRSRRIFQGEKILSTPSFGGEVKPSVPCCRFTACKRFLNATWKSGISGKIQRPFLAHIVPPFATRISGETTSGESWNV